MIVFLVGTYYLYKGSIFDTDPIPAFGLQPAAGAGALVRSGDGGIF